MLPYIQQAAQSGKRATVLNPIQWMMGILVTGAIGSFATKAPGFWSVFLLVLSALTFVLYVVAYVYFMFKNPDALRSEQYSLTKLALEMGDSLTGIRKEERLILMDEPPPSRTSALPEGDSSTTGHDEPGEQT